MDAQCPTYVLVVPVFNVLPDIVVKNYFKLLLLVKTSRSISNKLFFRFFIELFSFFLLYSDLIYFGRSYSTDIVVGTQSMFSVSQYSFTPESPQCNELQNITL